MSTAWMLQTLAAGALLSVGAIAVERVAGWFDLPRRGVWVASILGSLALPALALFAPGFLPAVGILPDSLAAATAAGPEMLPVTGVAAEHAWAQRPDTARAVWTDPSLLLSLAWPTASVAMLATLGWTLRKLQRIRADAVAMEVEGSVVRVAERMGPAVVGLVRPVVVVPRWVLTTSSEERRLILLHEREHIAGGDAWLLFASTLAVALMPWNLALWWQQRRLRAAVETDCDARVLARGESRRTYGGVLIRTSGSLPGLPLLSPAWGERGSHLERRIIAMTARHPRHRLLRSVPLLAIAVGGIAAACDVADRSAAEPMAPPVASKMQPPAESGVRSDSGEFMIVALPPDPAKGSLGMSMDWPDHQGPRYDHASGAIVPPTGNPVAKDVEPGGSAWRAGLREGDVILAVNGSDGRRTSLFGDRHPGDRYEVRVRRGEREHVVQLEVDPPQGSRDGSR